MHTENTLTLIEEFLLNEGIHIDFFYSIAFTTCFKLWNFSFIGIRISKTKILVTDKAFFTSNEIKSKGKEKDIKQ